MMTKIRRAEPGDFDAIFALVGDFATSFTTERAAFDLSAAQFMQDDSALLLVAENDGQLIGYCLGFDHYTFYANGRVSWVEEIMVQAEFRRHKVGRALMEHFEAWAKSRDSKLVALATRRASAFYAA